MAPATLPKLEDVQLTVPELQDSLIGLRADLARTRAEFARAAEESKLAKGRRDEAIARAATDAEGGTTEKRWAAIVKVGDQGYEEEARYARLEAEVKIICHQIMADASLLKSAARGQGDVGRYEDGP